MLRSMSFFKRHYTLRVSTGEGAKHSKQKKTRREEFILDKWMIKYYCYAGAGWGVPECGEVHGQVSAGCSGRSWEEGLQIQPARSEPTAVKSLWMKHKLVFKPGGRDPSEIYHCLLLISFGKSRFTPPSIWDQLFMTTVSGGCGGWVTPLLKIRFLSP